MSYLPTIIEAIADRIRLLTPSRQPTQPFTVPDLEEGPVTPVLARVGRQSRIVEIRVEAGPGDDGAAGVSDRHRADLSITVGYSTQDRMRWADAVRVEDAEAIQGELRDPAWWPVGTYSIETLDMVTHLEVTEGDREIGRLVSIPITVRYESEP